MDIKTADRLQQLRKAHGYSQEALSEKLGVSRQAVSKWERGESSPDTDNLIAIANLYSVTLDELINGDGAVKKSAYDNLSSAPEELPSVPKIQNPVKRHSLYKDRARRLLKFPFALIVLAVYVVLNLIIHMWHPLWIMFLFLPIYYHYVGACYTKTKKGYLFALPIPEIVLLAYLVLSFATGLWGAMAVLFLTIPIYYWAVAFYMKK